MKTTYWLLIVIGILSIIASIYLYIQGKEFNDYFISGLLGVVVTVTGIISLRKMKEKEGE